MNLWFINKDGKFSFVYDNLISGGFDPYSNDEKMDKIFSADVKLRDIGTLKLVKYSTEKAHTPFDSSKFPKINPNIVSLCKSNLQKCIRRGEEDKAIRTAFALWIYNPDELLRRLPIIMIEDTLPHPESFIKCIWWMCAISKGYLLSKSELEELLGIVSIMCESKGYVVFRSDMKVDPVNINNWKTASPQHRDFMWALQIRKMYGGLKGDIQMLNYHQKIWNETVSRSSGGSNNVSKSSGGSNNISKSSEELNNLHYCKLLIDQLIYTIDLESVDIFNKNNILLCSIDFHSYPYILDRINEKTGYDQDTIKDLIWMCSSRINIRTPINIEKYIEISSEMRTRYRDIEKHFQSFSTWLLGKMLIY